MLGWSVTKTRLCNALAIDGKSLPGAPFELWIVPFDDAPQFVRNALGAPRIFRFFGKGDFQRQSNAPNVEPSTKPDKGGDSTASPKPRQSFMQAAGSGYRKRVTPGQWNPLPRSRTLDDFENMASETDGCVGYSPEHSDPSSGEIDLCGESDEDVEVSSEGGYESFDVGGGTESEEESQPDSSRGYWYSGDAKRGKRSILSEREPSNGVGEELSRDRTQPDGHVPEGKEN